MKKVFMCFVLLGLVACTSKTPISAGEYVEPISGRSGYIDRTSASELKRSNVSESAAEEALKKILDMRQNSTSLLMEGSRVGAKLNNKGCRFYLRINDDFYASLVSSGFVDMQAAYKHGRDSVIKNQDPVIVENSDTKVRVEVSYTVATNGMQGSSYIEVQKLNKSGRQEYLVKIGGKNSAGADGGMACKLIEKKAEE